MSSQGSNGHIRTLDLCFIDIETTGSTFGFHEIIDIAGIRTSADGKEVRSTWRRKVQPQHPERMSAYARELTGYDAASWASFSVADESMWKDFAEFAKSSVPVCHNPSFDRAFVSLSAAQSGLTDLGLDYHWIGTESLAWPLYRQGKLHKLSLATLCEYLGLSVEPSLHNALDGAHACRRVYLALMSHWGSTERATSDEQTPSSLPHNLRSPG